MAWYKEKAYDLSANLREKGMDSLYASGAILGYESGYKDCANNASRHLAKILTLKTNIDPKDINEILDDFYTDLLGY